MNNKNYGILNLRFIDAIIEKKRYEMFKIFKKKISNVSINSFLDVGTTEESLLSSSNFFVKKFESIKVKKSITEKLYIDEINKFKSDLVISSATIEHVGHFKNQKKMIENIINLTNKYFFVTTPYRFYPIDFHTKIPFIHMLPKLIHRKILNILNLKDFAKEENLNLLDISLVKKIIEELNTKGFRIEILKIKLFGMISNLIIFGERIK